jgi:hypothetical protein
MKDSLLMRLLVRQAVSKVQTFQHVESVRSTSEQDVQERALDNDGKYCRLSRDTEIKLKRKDGRRARDPHD